jgi:hypothetical protein
MSDPHGDLRTSYRRMSPWLEALEGRRLLTSGLSQTPVPPPVGPQPPIIVHSPVAPQPPIIVHHPNQPILPGPRPLDERPGPIEKVRHLS